MRLLPQTINMSVKVGILWGGALTLDEMAGGIRNNSGKTGVQALNNSKRWVHSEFALSVARFGIAQYKRLPQVRSYWR